MNINKIKSLIPKVRATREPHGYITKMLEVEIVWREYSVQFQIGVLFDKWYYCRWCKDVSCTDVCENKKCLRSRYYEVIEK